MGIIQSEPKTYQEWIDQGKKQLSTNRIGAQISYEMHQKLLMINMQHTISQILFQKGKSFENDKRPALNNLCFRICKQQDRHATELEKLQYNYISLFIHNQKADPNYDHEIPKNLEDYDQQQIILFLVKEYIQNVKANYAIQRNQQNQVKTNQRFYYMLQIVEDGFQFEQAHQYFERALQFQEGKYEILLKIGDIQLIIIHISQILYRSQKFKTKKKDS